MMNWRLEDEEKNDCPDAMENKNCNWDSIVYDVDLCICGR